ncbi:helix-turn-helix transcriptional regulator [Ottowia thiooxydans]
MKGHTVHKALTDLLGAVADEDRWDEALHGYATSLGGDQVGWFVLASDPQQLAEWGVEFAAHPDPSYWLKTPGETGTPALIGRGITAEATLGYASQYREQDPLWDAAMELYSKAEKRGHCKAWVVTDAPRHTGHCHHRTSIYNEFLRPHGIGTRMFGGSRDARDPAGNLFASIFRLRDDEGFTFDQEQRFRSEFAAVQRVAVLHREMLALRTRTRGVESVMEHLSVGMLFFDTAARLLHANARATELAARREQVVLRGLLKAPAKVAAEVQTLFQRSLRGESACLELPGGILLVSLALGDLKELGLAHSHEGVTVVLMERTADAAAAVSLARHAYRLSPTEASLLLALLHGQTPRDFADARGVRIRTVRTQLSSLLMKTRTQRQQDLVALMARLMLLTPANASRSLDLSL